MRTLVIALLSFSIAGVASAQVAAGRWVNREVPSMSMAVEPMGNGWSIVYDIKAPNGTVTKMSIKAPMDGTETAFYVDGKVTTQTYVGKRLDPRHSTGVVKMDGKVSAISKAELSADGKTVTVMNELPASVVGAKPVTLVEHWDKQ